MFVQDVEILGIMLRLSKHYTQNIATRFISPFLISVHSDSTMDSRIFALTDNPVDAIERGLSLDELYLQINAMARFIDEARSTIIPFMSSPLVDRSLGLSANEQQKILRDMAISNFAPNIDILEQYTKELFEAVIRFDKDNSKEKTVYEKIFENMQTARLLRI